MCISDHPIEQCLVLLGQVAEQVEQLLPPLLGRHVVPGLLGPAGQQLGHPQEHPGADGLARVAQLQGDMLVAPSETVHSSQTIINRPGVARAVLQTPPSLYTTHSVREAIKKSLSFGHCPKGGGRGGGGFNWNPKVLR